MSRSLQTQPISATAFAALAALFLSGSDIVRADDQSPLSFGVSKNGERDYSLNWNLQLASAVPVETGMRVGIAAATDGRVTEVPLGVSARIGTLDDPGSAARRALQLDMTPLSATVNFRDARTVELTPSLDAQLRGSIGTSIKPDGSEQVVGASRQIAIDGLMPRTTVTATASVSSGQRGVAGNLNVERKFAKGVSVSADVSGGAVENSASVSARYSWRW